MNNPLLLPFYLPPFSRIKFKHIIPAINEAVNNCKFIIEKILTNEEMYSWDNLVQKVDEANDTLRRIYSTVRHMNSVIQNEELRKIYEQLIPLLSKYESWIGQHKTLYKAYFNLSKNVNFNVLNYAQKKSITNTIKDFKLSGVNLSKNKQKRYKEIVTKLSELSNEYSNNVLDSTKSWTKQITDVKELSGIPTSALMTAKEQARIKKVNGYLLTLDMPVYSSIMMYCDNQNIRKEIYQAYYTRASDQGPNAGKWDNSLIMVEILNLRYELAKLLGFDNYASLSMSNKMMKNTSQVFDFLINLTKRVRTQAEKEIKQLYIFAKEQFGIAKLEPWDIKYYSEKQKQHLYGINNEYLREFFPENRIINGLFNIIHQIYGVIVRERFDVDVWHDSVRFFDIYDDKHKLRGSFYLDLYTRENKHIGAWMDECVNQMRKTDGSLQKPVAYLVCNFTPPINNEPTKLTHDEVVTLFHEFGHGLHHILTSIDVSGVSGINGVPWDAIELPSQFMVNWCWEIEVLRSISSHYKTGLPLPEKLLIKINAIKNYQAALLILRQLEFSIFDFRLHAEFNKIDKNKILEVLFDINRQVSVIHSCIWERFPHSFVHIFSGGYAAGYYSYLWANVLAADAFSLFKQKGIFNREIGKLFMDNILSQGGARDPMELFKRFRGREPKIESMLEYYEI